jgi:hypothetical protein
MQFLRSEPAVQPTFAQNGTPPDHRPPVRVNVETCQRLARLLTYRPIPRDEEDSSLPGFSRVEVGNFYLLLVAICHQTSPRSRPPLEGTVGGRRMRGWDYLSAKLEAAARSDKSLLDPEKWERITAQQFVGIFHDTDLGDRLSDPEGRVKLVRNLGAVMRQEGWRSFEDLYRLSGGRAATGKPNLFGLLSRFQAYDDPVRKKSSFLLALMRNSGLWHYIDDEQVGPPVDYHEVRGHLRIGTVIVTDPELSRKLIGGLPVTAEEDVTIRGAVYDAIMLLSELTGLRNPSQLHYLFWNVFRTHCLRESPLCYEPAPTLPERYRHLELVGEGEDRRCPFSGVCASASSTQRYYEHVFETDYY